MTCRAALAALILLAAHALPLAHAAGVPGVRSETIQFAQGAPVASDATEPMAHSRDGDATVVRFGADERYAIPDALVRGARIR
jgi:hypothetical protein